jgi:hypothetical protein
VDAPSDKTTWSYIYGTYFGSGTPGHCGNAGCHQTIRRGFACGTDKSSCYNGLVAVGLIGTRAPTQPLVDPTASPVAWFNQKTGSMPADNPVANTLAEREVRAWVAAGANDD